ncbi:MAG: 16S rRNA (cytidine(1402)-2'-O)-methyltransferase [Acidobacteriia bacterium]|nr:16S rRNA (cytidine(1402)-2'-O)-methyltransferase [Terriglobia bacterium]
MSPSPATAAPLGCLFVVGTPIGNLEDISLRALRVLREADQIACEDTRHTRKLLEHYDIHRPLVSYHAHNETSRAPELLAALQHGAKIALVTDAGTPMVSDPGYHLVVLCVRHAIPVVPVPGPSALLAALCACGLPADEFLFAGFLPSRTGERRRALERLRLEERTIVLYEAPHRAADSLADALEILGDRPACLAREITKIHEEFQRGSLAQLAEQARSKPPRGEITLILGPPEAQQAAKLQESAQTLAQRVEELMRQAHLDRKEALKLAARERGLTRRAAYDQLLEARERTEED